MEFILYLLMLLHPASKPASLHTVTLTWILSTEDGVRWQNIYRQNNCAGPLVRRAQVTDTTVEWTDESVKSGATYCYRVGIQEGTQNVALSDAVQVVIPNP